MANTYSHRHKFFYPVVLTLIVLIAVFTQGFPLLFSYIRVEGGLRFITLHDSLWHLSLIEELRLHFPPNHPGFSGVKLVNYHYLSDLLLSLIGSIFHLPTWFVYFRLAPIIASLGFSISTLLVLKTFKLSKLSLVLGLILVLFGGSFAWLIPLLSHQPRWHANSFMLDQPYDMLTNAHTYFGFVLFLIALYILAQLEYAIKPRSNKLSLLLGVTIGVAFYIKSYASILAYLSLWCVCFFSHTKIRRQMIPALCVSSLLILFAFIFNSNANQAGLIWSPGWILTKMIEDQDRVSVLSDFSLRMSYYLSVHNYLKVALIIALKLAIYLIGNLGIRVLGFMYLLWKLFQRKLKSAVLIFLLALSIFGLVLPLFFNQGQSAYNIVQFGPYALITTSIATALLINRLHLKLRFLWLLTLVILVLSLPTSIKSFSDNLAQVNGEVQITSKELEAINFIRYQTPESSIVITHPESRHQLLMFIPALGAREAYFSGYTFAILTGLDTAARLQEQHNFFTQDFPIQEKVSFLQTANINYIYLDNPSEFNFTKIASQLPVKKVFSNSQVTIYQIQ